MGRLLAQHPNALKSAQTLVPVFIEKSLKSSIPSVILYGLSAGRALPGGSRLLLGLYLRSFDLMV
jgi:hypothetical protein